MLSPLVNVELAIKDKIFECNDLKQTVPEEITNFSSNTVKPLGFDTNIVMEILQNRIYSNKNIAFQELPCNGRDAIVRRIISGYKDFSPEIKIIFNNKDNCITISDNGCGMSEKIIDEVYRFYGRSDKRNTLDEIGMFGLGSKSVFAVSDEFTVETDAIEDKMHCKYLVTKRGIIQLSRSASTGQYGTSVTFAKSTDFSTYEIEEFISRKFKLWNLPVNIYNISSEGTITKTRTISKESCMVEDILKGNIPDGIVKFETEDYIFISGPNIKEKSIFVGQVPYVISSFSTKLEDNFNKSINIFIKNPNAITISATRENVEHDEKFKMLISDIESKYQNVLEKAIDATFNVDINNISNFKDIEYFWNIYLIQNIIKTKYPKMYDILYDRIYTIMNGSKKQAYTLFTILKNKKERVISTITWKKGDVKNLHTIPENQQVILLYKNGGICQETIECDKCITKKVGDVCEHGLSKKHIVMDMFPEFVPQKIVREKNTNKFRALNLNSQKQSILDIISNMNCTFTLENFKTSDCVYQISAEKLKKLQEFNPDLKVTTEKQYRESKIASMVFTSIDKNKYALNNEYNNYTTIVHSCSTYGIDNIIKNMFCTTKDLFITEVLDKFTVEYLKTKGITVINSTEFLKLRKIKPKLKLNDVPVEIIFELIEKLNDMGLTLRQEGSVLTYEKPKKVKEENVRKI